MADRRRILERKSIIEQQPITKWISVIETDGQSKQKRKHLVRFKQTRDVDSLKTDLTNTLQPTLGKRKYKKKISKKNLYIGAVGQAYLPRSNSPASLTYP